MMVPQIDILDILLDHKDEILEKFSNIMQYTNIHTYLIELKKAR